MKYLRITLLLAAVVTVDAVGSLAFGRGMNKLLKSGDTEKIYQAGQKADRTKKLRNTTVYIAGVFTPL